MRGFVVGFVVGAASIYFAMGFHVVQADDGCHVIAKTSLGLKDTYVDIRKIDPSDWKDHMGLADALVKANRSDLLHGSAETAVKQAWDKMWRRDS